MKQRKTAFFTLDSRDQALPVTVMTIGLNCLQNTVNRPAGYESFHFFRCLQGQGLVQAGQQTFTLGPGMGMILYPNETHHYRPLPEEGDPFNDSPGWLVDWITFDGSALHGILEWLGIHGSEAFDLQFPSLLNNDLEEVSDIMHAGKPTIKMDLSCLMYKLLSNLYWSLPAGRSQTRMGQYRRLEPVLRHIEEHFGDPLSLDQLADVAGVSPRHLCSLFREILHIRPFWHLNEVRINRSKRLLIEDRTLSVSAIASACGYPNICYFNQLFKKNTGMSPTAFRSMH